MCMGRACQGSACRSCSGAVGPSEGSGQERGIPGRWLLEGSVELELMRETRSDAAEVRCPPESEETGPEDVEGGGQLWLRG